MKFYKTKFLNYAKGSRGDELTNQVLFYLPCNYFIALINVIIIFVIINMEVIILYLVGDSNPRPSITMTHQSRLKPDLCSLEMI